MKKSAAAIDLTKVKEETPKLVRTAVMAPPPPPRPKSERDSGTANLPADIHAIPYNASDKYFPEDEEKLKDVKVILRVRKMEQDGSIWLLAGPLSAKVTDTTATDVVWIESLVMMRRFPKLTLKFFASFLDFSKEEVLKEVVDA